MLMARRPLFAGFSSSSSSAPSSSTSSSSMFGKYTTLSAQDDMSAEDELNLVGLNHQLGGMNCLPSFEMPSVSDVCDASLYIYIYVLIYLQN